jgi:hypothetical protein
MYLSNLFHVAVLVCLSTEVSSSPVAPGATPNCVVGDVAVVKHTAHEPEYFCTWWNSESVEHAQKDLIMLLI